MVKSVLLVAVVVLMTYCTEGVWQNDYDQPLNFQCPSDDQTIDYVKSVHSNGAEDRRFDIGCKPIGLDTSMATKCFWESNYANSYDGILHYECPANYYISGMSSVHDNGPEDRIWKFRCCEIADVHLLDCEMTGWTNQLDHEQNFKVPANKAMKGVISIHNNRAEDRQYEYIVCGLTVIHNEGPVVG